MAEHEINERIKELVDEVERIKEDIEFPLRNHPDGKIESYQTIIRKEYETLGKIAELNRLLGK